MSRRRPAPSRLVLPKPRPAKVPALRHPEDRVHKQLAAAPRWFKEALADLADDIVPALKRLGGVALLVQLAGLG